MGGGPVTAQGPRAGAGPSPGTGRGQGLEVPVETKINIIIHQNHNSPIQQHYISEWLLFTKAQNMPSNTFTITSLCFCISVVSFKKKSDTAPEKNTIRSPLF